MSLLFDALNRAQGTAPGTTPETNTEHAQASARPLSGVADTAASADATPAGQRGTQTANSLLSAGNSPRSRLLPYVIAGLVLLTGTGAWWLYQQSQSPLVMPVQPAIPLAARTTPDTSAVVAVSSVASADTASQPLALADSPTGAGTADATAADTRKAVPHPAPLGGPRGTSRKAGGAPKIVAGHSPDPLQDGYLALMQGRLEQSEQNYQLALAQHPHEKDALLGMAVIAQRRMQTQRAADLYQQVLREDIGNAAAAAGLVSLSEQADPVAAESQLKQLIDLKSNAPEFHYALGNVLARQQRWGEAQQAFFRAHGLAPANAMYAYNLAVSLEHLHQPTAALPFYVKALQLTAAGDATLDRDAIQKRIVELQQPAPEAPR